MIGLICKHFDLDPICHESAKMQLLQLRKVAEFATRTTFKNLCLRSSSGITERMAPNVIQRGSLYNDNFRLFFKNEEGQVISPLHDIPLR